MQEGRDLVGLSPEGQGRGEAAGGTRRDPVAHVLAEVPDLGLQIGLAALEFSEVAPAQGAATPMMTTTGVTPPPAAQER